MTDRFVTVGDDLTLPDMVLVADANLPANLQPTALSATIARPAVPVYAGTRTKTWNQGQCLYNGESPELRKIRDLATKGRTGQTLVRAAAVGDSKTFGAGLLPAESIASDSYPAQLRDILAARDGAIYGNLGDKRWSANTNWTHHSNTDRNDLNSVGGGTTSTITLTLPACVGFDIYAYCSPGGVLQYAVDGGTTVDWAISASSPWRKLSVTGLADTTHTVVFTTTAAVTLSRVEPAYSTPGLTISNAGRSSSHAGNWLNLAWVNLYNTVFNVSNTSGIKPDFAIMNIGTNTGTSTLADIETVATNIKALGIPLLLVVFGGVSQDGGFYDAKRTKMYDIADTLDLPLIDFTALIGNNTVATAAGLMADTVHENSKGYALEAAGLARIISPAGASSMPFNSAQVTSLGWADAPPALYSLDAALAKSATIPAVVIGLGDSLWEGLSATIYAESIPGRAAGAFRKRYRIAGGGSGFIPSAWPLEGDSVAPQDMIPTYTGTVTKATGATAVQGPGRKSVQMSAAATGTFKPVVCTGFDIIHAKSISSGGSFTYSVDGGTAVSVSTSAERVTLTAATTVGATVLPVSSVPSDWYPGVQLSVEASGSVEAAYIASISGLNVTLKTALTLAHNSGVPVAAHSNGGYITPVRGLAVASHAVTITAVTTTTIEGIRYYDGDETSGVHWINAGHGGIRADQLKLTGNGDHSMKTIAAMKPAAIFCDLGINDSGVQTPSQFTGNLTTLKADVLAAVAARGFPKPSWVQVIPYEPETLTGRFNGTNWSEYVEAIYAWAKADTTGPGGASGVHVIDLGRRMPGSRSDTKLFNADLLHPTSEGSRVFVDWMVKALPISQ